MIPLDCPTVEGPRDLPRLRRWLLRQYGKAGSFGWLSEAEYITHALPAAPLWWVEGGACDLLAESAPTIPGETQLTMEDMPSQEGLAVFEHDLIGTDAYPGAEGRAVTVSAVEWMWGRLPDMDGETRFGATFLMFSRMRLDDESHPMQLLWKEMFDPSQLHGEMWAYIGRTDWVFGWEVERVIPDNPHGFDPVANKSFAEDRRLMMALWKLATTPVVRVTAHELPRFMRRQAQREGVNDEVRVVSLHGPTIGEPPTQGEGATGARHYRHRWVVRPHWVNQPYGPGRTQRRLILRGPFTKGPEGAPLIGGERVWRIAPPPNPERN